MSILFGRKTSLGLDIGEQTIKLVQTQKKGDKIIITGHAAIDTPPDTVSGGLITDPEKLGHTLSRLVKDLKIKNMPVVAAVAGQQVFTKLLTMPTMKHHELRQATYFQASSFLPIDIEEITSDIIPVRQLPDSDEPQTELFFVAARRTQVDNLYLACQIAGLKLTAVEIEPLALQRVYAPQIDANATTAILNIGAHRSYMAFFAGQQLVFMRSISFELSGIYQTATDTKPDLTENMTLQETAATYDAFPAHPLATLVPEITRSVDYFELQNNDAIISKIIICGGGARLADIESYLAPTLGLTVEIGQPHPALIWPQAADEKSPTGWHHDFAEATGLALWGQKIKSSLWPDPINLLNYKLEEQDQAKHLYKEYLAYGLILLLLAGTSWGLNFNQHQKIVNLETKNKSIQNQVDQMKKQQALGAFSQQQIDELNNYHNLVQELKLHKTLDPNFLDLVYHTHSAGITLDKISISGDKLDISAYTNHQAAMIDFIEQLQTNPHLHTVHSMSTKTNENTGEIDFSLTLNWEGD